MIIYVLFYFLIGFLNGERNAFNFDCDPNQDLICSHGNPFFDTSLTKRITDKVLFSYIYTLYLYLYIVLRFHNYLITS